MIDNPTTCPAWVRNVAQYMKGNTEHYIFISTISAYANDKNTWADESDPLAPMPAGLDPYALPADAVATRNYGPLKAFSEKEVEKHYPGINTIIRPGLIVGPLDVSDRFTYWPYRIDKGGEVLAPGDGNDPVQIIDSRDIAEWTIRMAENKTFGTFNATGPTKPLHDVGDAVRHQKAVTTERAQFTWVPADFLAEQKVRRVEQHAGVGARRSGQRRVLAPEHRQGARGRSDLPSARRDGEGHARVEQDATGGRAAGAGRGAARRDLGAA